MGEWIGLEAALPGRIPIDASFTLVRMTREDAPAVFRLYAQAAVTEHLPVPTMTREEEGARFLENLLDRARRTQGVVWKIVRAEECLGLMDLLHWNPEDRSASLAYVLDPRYWGQGIVSRALAVLLAEARRADIRLLIAPVLQGNEGSVRVLQKHGFKLLRTEPIEIKGDQRVAEFYGLTLAGC